MAKEGAGKVSLDLKIKTNLQGQIKSLFQKIGDGFKNAIGDKIKSAFSGLTKKTKSSVGTLGKGFAKLGTTLKTMFINATKEGFQNLARYSSSTNQSFSMLMSSLTQLKNSFATAFAPVFSVVAPILTTFINLLSSAMNQVGAFFAALTGQKSYTRAVAVTQDYVASLGTAATGADDAKKAAEDYQKTLAGFDEIEKLNSQSAVGSPSSGGKSGEAGVSPADMFETVPIDSGIGSLAEKMKALFNAQDWLGLGSFIGEKVNGLVDKIDFAGIGEKAGKGIDAVFKTIYGFLETVDFEEIGSGIATSLNNVLANIDFNTFGSTIGSGIMGIVDTVYGFVTTLDWSAIGTAISDSINGFFDTVDFSEIAQTLSESLLGILTIIRSLLMDTNWFAIGDAIWEFVSNINWGEILGNLVAATIELLFSFEEMIIGFWSGVWDSIGEYFSEKVEECGGNVVLGLLKGIWDGVVGIGQWLYDNLVKPIIDGVKSMLGIHSPSTVFAEIGGFLVSGLFEGIKNLWQSIVDFFSNALNGIKNIFSDVFNSIKTIVSDIFNGIWNVIRGVVNGIIGGIEWMANAIVNGVNTVIRGLNRINFKMPDWLGGKSFGFNISQLSTVSIPRLATGGVIDTPTLAMVGEDGQEAVVPLEKNTGWINNLADKINAQADKKTTGGGITSTELNMAVSRIVGALEALGFYIDGELLAKAVQKGNNKINRCYNTVTIQ